MFNVNSPPRSLSASPSGDDEAPLIIISAASGAPLSNPEPFYEAGRRHVHRSISPEIPGVDNVVTVCAVIGCNIFVAGQMFCEHCTEADRAHVAEDVTGQPPRWEPRETWPDEDYHRDTQNYHCDTRNYSDTCDMAYVSESSFTGESLSSLDEYGHDTKTNRHGDVSTIIDCTPRQLINGFLSSSQ